MIGAAMTSVLHGETSHLDDLIDDWKALFPVVLASASGAAASEPERERRKQKAKR
jgi:hypothetical protein